MAFWIFQRVPAQPRSLGNWRWDKIHAYTAMEKGGIEAANLLRMRHREDGRIALSRGAEDIIAPASLMFGEKRIGSGTTGSRADILKMLDFAAGDHIMPMLEVMPLQKCNETMERLKANQARYRIVLCSEE